MSGCEKRKKGGRWEMFKKKKHKNLVEVGTSCPLLLRRGGVTEKLRAR